MKNNKTAVEYFKHFEEGNLKELSKMYHDDIHLIDWNGQWKGKEEVLKMNKGLFDSNKVEVIVHEIEQPIFRESRVYCTISITITSDTEIVLKVIDIIDFDNNGKITRIEAFNG
jgi:ketosteroid isomerase-like protein